MFLGGRTGISVSCYNVQKIEEDWQNLLNNLLGAAKMVLFIPGTSESLSYEWGLILKNHLSKTLIVMPPSLSKRERQKYVIQEADHVSDTISREEEWEKFRLFSYNKFAIVLPKYLPRGGFFFIRNHKFWRIPYSSEDLEYFLEREPGSKLTLSKTLLTHYGEESATLEKSFI